MVTYCVPELFMRCMYTVLRKQAAPTAYKKFYMQMEAARILSFLGSLLILIIHIRDTKPLKMSAFMVIRYIFVPLKNLPHLKKSRSPFPFASVDTHFFLTLSL